MSQGASPALAAQIGRMLEEERLLRQDDAYAKYASAVRWRFLPGVF